MITGDLFSDTFEAQKYLTEQIITYIGNKRTLLDFIGSALKKVKAELGKEKLTVFDVFSGSGVVSRYFKQHAEKLYSNDLELYANIINRCYLANKSEVDLEAVSDWIDRINSTARNHPVKGFVSELYAPQDDQCIQPGERVFYTCRNAAFIDTARQEIEKAPAELKNFLLAPLLYEASVHTNTSGVFKGFYKDRSGLGAFGGTGKNALTRILGEIDLKVPVLSNFECESIILQQDASQAAKMVRNADIAYLDPPYNQHPYGSNYFMLNLIAKNERPQDISSVSGIPKEWNHSPYNRKADAQKTLFDLIDNLDAKYVLISYNSEGFVKKEDFIDFLNASGEVSFYSQKYNTFRGSRNLNQRDLHVKEYLFLLKKN